MNQVSLIGNIKGRVNTGQHEKWGKWALFTIDFSEKVNDTWYHQYIPCSATKKVAEKLSEASEGDKVLVLGKIKSKEKDGTVKITVDAKEFAVLEASTKETATEEVAVDDIPDDVGEEE